MALRGVWQLQKLVVNYCDWGGSSRGIRYDIVWFLTRVVVVPLDHGVLVAFRVLLRKLLEIRLMHVLRCGNWLGSQSIVAKNALRCRLVWSVCSYDLEPKSTIVLPL
jgi:hypothetical protein